MGVPSDRFGSPDPAVFRSMIQQKSGIPAHIKAKAGVLFPLPAALCFLETVCGCWRAKGQRSISVTHPSYMFAARCGPMGPSNVLTIYTCAHPAAGAPHPPR